jgi:hypothetical protein
LTPGMTTLRRSFQEAFLRVRALICPAPAEPDTPEGLTEGGAEREEREPLLDRYDAGRRRLLAKFKVCNDQDRKREICRMPDSYGGGEEAL